MRHRRVPYCEKSEGYSGLLGAKPYAGGGCILGVAGSVEEIFGLLNPPLVQDSQR